MRINKIFHNRVTIRSMDGRGRIVAEQIAKNTHTYAMADVIINALLRSGPSVVTHLYCRFGDSGSNPGNLNPEGGELINTTRADFVASSDGIRGGLWVPALTSAIQESTDSVLYAGNQATYLFRIPYNIPANQVSPADNFMAGDSYIYAMGLGVAVAGGDRTQDLIVTVLNSFTPFPVTPGGQVGIDYPLTMEL